ncbi:uncharacterized protein LOC135817462 [Sycon ciliatum]|uniref:uncharacterized protein LOC135817462 n=1 Tax=Sycon ciliatum TaxID=27933 RepID=UPI0031F6FB82
MALVKLADRLFRRGVLQKTYFPATGSLRACATTALPHSILHSHWPSDEEIKASKKRTLEDCTPEAVLRACGNLRKIDNLYVHEEMCRLAPLVLQLKDSSPYFYNQSCAIILSTAIYLNAPMPFSAEAGIVDDFKQMLSESLVTAVACVGLLQYKLKMGNSRDASSEEGELKQMEKQIEMHLKDHSDAQQMEHLLSWWAHSRKPSPDSAFGKVIWQSVMDGIRSEWSVLDAIRVLQQIVAFPGSPEKKLFHGMVLKRIESEGSQPEHILGLLQYVRNSELSWLYEVTFSRFSSNLHKVLQRSAPVFNSIVGTYPQIVDSGVAARTFKLHSEEQWLDSNIHVMRMMQQTCPELFETVARHQLPNAGVELATELLSLAKGGLAEWISSDLLARFPVETMPQATHVELLLAKVADSGDLPLEILAKIKASNDGISCLLHRMLQRPRFSVPEQMTEPIAQLLMDVIELSFVTDLPNVVMLLCTNWQWMTAARRDRATHALMQRVPEMSIDELPLMHIHQLGPSAVRSLFQRLNSFVLTVVPEEACSVAAELLKQRLFSADLYRNIVDYCVRHLDSIPDQELAFVLDTVLSLSAIGRIPLDSAQVQAVLNTIHARMSLPNQSSTLVALGWALAANDTFHSYVFSDALSQVNGKLPKPRNDAFHTQRRLLQMYESFELTESASLDSPIPPSFILECKQVSPHLEGFKPHIVDHSAGFSEFISALQHVYPEEVASLRANAFGALFAVVEPNKTSLDVSSETDESMSSQQPMIFAFPRASRFSYLQNVPEDTYAPSGDLLLTLRNMERLHGYRTCLVPFAEWYDAQDLEARCTVLRHVADGKYDHLLPAWQSSPQRLCPQATSATAEKIETAV